MCLGTNDLIAEEYELEENLRSLFRKWKYFYCVFLDDKDMEQLDLVKEFYSDVRSRLESLQQCSDYKELFEPKL